MIRETLCMWLLWLMLKLFGQETVCAMPEPALRILNDYMQEVQK